MSDLNVLVVVLSRNYSTGLGVIRALGAAGYTVDLVSSVKKKGSSIIASSSKYIRKSVEVLTYNIQNDNGDGLINEIMKYVPEAKDNKKIVIFPTDDFTTSVVDLHRDKLRDLFILPTIKDGESGALVNYMDKIVQSSIAEKCGMLVPSKWIINLEELSIPRDMIYPCFVKPLKSIFGSKNEMRACYSEIQLKEHLKHLASSNPNRYILIEEYLRIDKEYDLSGVCLDQEIIIPAVIEKTNISIHENGVTMAGKLVNKEILGETIAKIEKLLKEFGYTGMFDMELNLCGGKIYFNEINFRSGGPNFSYFLSGVNLPDIFVKHCAGMEVSEEEKSVKELGKTFVYEKVAWEDYIYGHMTRAELKECIESADFTLLNNDNDPKPGQIFDKKIRLSAIKNKLKKHKSKTNLDEKIIILGRNYGNILAMARALGMKGYDIEVLRLYKRAPKKINPMNNLKPEKYSKYVGKFHECIVANDEMKAINFLEKIGEKQGEDEKTLLLPVDDFSACLLDKYLNGLKNRFIVPNAGNEAGKITSLMDKNCQKVLAKSFGLPVIGSVLVKSSGGEFEIPDCINYPCFIKPNVSAKSTKGKMKVCKDYNDLMSTLQRFAKDEDFEILVEDYIDIKTEYSLLGISADNKVIAPCMFKAIKGGHRERKGVAMMGETVSTEAFKKLVDDCCRFIETLEYTGMFDVDFIEDKNGNVYFVELNFRAGASVYGFIESGVNLPGIYADYLLRDEPFVNKGDSARAGTVFLSEKILIEEFIRNDITISDIRRDMRDADVLFVKDKADEAPYRHFRRYFFVASILRIPYGVKDKM